MIVEIGPGLGTLTRLISESAKRVIAIELDKRLIGKLKETLSASSNVEVIQADALKFLMRQSEADLRSSPISLIT